MNLAAFANGVRTKLRRIRPSRRVLRKLNAIAMVRRSARLVAPCLVLRQNCPHARVRPVLSGAGLLKFATNVYTYSLMLLLQNSRSCERSIRRCRTRRSQAWSPSCVRRRRRKRRPKRKLVAASRRRRRVTAKPRNASRPRPANSRHSTNGCVRITSIEFSMYTVRKVVSPTYRVRLCEPSLRGGSHIWANPFAKVRSRANPFAKVRTRANTFAEGSRVFITTKSYRRRVVRSSKYYACVVDEGDDDCCFGRRETDQGASAAHGRQPEAARAHGRSATRAVSLSSMGSCAYHLRFARTWLFQHLVQNWSFAPSSGA